MQLGATRAVKVAQTRPPSQVTKQALKETLLRKIIGSPDARLHSTLTAHSLGSRRGRHQACPPRSCDMQHQNLSTKRAAHQKKTQMLPTHSPGQRHAVETTVLAQVCSLCPLQSELDHAKLLVDHAVAVQENDHAHAVVVQRFCTHAKNHQKKTIMSMLWLFKTP